MTYEHLYVHVPFCTRRCSYCDFAIAVRRVVPVAEYLDALECELRLRLPDSADGGLRTVYLGGGTPSKLPADAVTRVIAMLRRRLGIAEGAEITIEANPDDVTPAAVAAWLAAGIGRVSLGIQSFDDRVLSWMHRSHDGRQAKEAARLLVRSGFENWSLDLIFGLPASLGRDWRADLEIALELGPPHLSVYGLTVEPHTPLYRWHIRGTATAADEERYASEFLFAHELLESAGYLHYEVSNYARPGFQSRHNLAYWARQSYLGLGPSAHSFDGRTRRWNVRHYEAWRRALVEGRDPVEGEERLSDGQVQLEEVYLGLRSGTGVLIPSRNRRLAEEYEKRGWLRRDGDRWAATTEGWLVLDHLAVSLTDAGSPY